MIIANSTEHQTPQFRVLSDSNCQQIYAATLECLDRIGVQVNNADARQLLAAAGARVDGTLVRIPNYMVQQALGSTPRSFTVWGRDGSKPMQVAPDRVHYGPGLTNTFYIDPETGEKRPARRGDASLTAQLCDGLDNIDYVMGLAMLGDVTPELASVYEFAEMIANTTKPIVAWSHSSQNIASIYRMAVAVAGSEENFRRRPSFALFSTYPSPLRHSDEDLANLMWAAEHDVPVVYSGGPTVGQESPFTSASALVIHQANVLSGLVIVQLVKGGAPMAVGGIPSAMDLRTARPAYGSPEMSLNSAAACDLARYVGLPFMGTAGASESKLLDSQAAIESSIQVLMAALSGAAMVHDIGFLDGANIGSLELLVMNDEIIGMVKRILRGVQVNADTIMLDLIEKVGPGGQFLTELSSAKLGRKEIWMPTLMDRKPFDVWDKQGSLSMEERIKQKLQKLLQTHRAPALDPAAAEEIEKLLAEAETGYHIDKAV
ncbi:MAG: trimethylamine methyltransferase family protein [Anaerolineaceae bacterium]|nr:trimethylamine methyltransferase family protein [Anaerolineaceae bacterium]